MWLAQLSRARQATPGKGPAVRRDGGDEDVRHPDGTRARNITLRQSRGNTIVNGLAPELLASYTCMFVYVRTYIVCVCVLGTWLHFYFLFFRALSSCI